MLLLALATFGSEDAACVAAGVLVAQGRIGIAGAVLGCAAGIFVGDVGLFAAGRIIGRRIIARWPFKRMISPASLAAASASLNASGPSVILASRFLPGTRVPTYIAAGVLGLDAWLFTRAFAVAALLWTPLLVGVSALTASGAAPALQARTAAGMIALPAACVGALHVLRRVVTHRGRRRLAGAWLRLTRWEFWPPWVFYPPVLAWIAWLIVRHRSVTVFTAANPGMPAAGFVGESKSEI